MSDTQQTLMDWRYSFGSSPGDIQIFNNPDTSQSQRSQAVTFGWLDLLGEWVPWDIGIKDYRDACDDPESLWGGAGCLGSG